MAAGARLGHPVRGRVPVVAVVLLALAVLAGCAGWQGPTPGPQRATSTGAPRPLEPPLEFRPVMAVRAAPCAADVGQALLVLPDPDSPGACLELGAPELRVAQLAGVAARYDQANLQWVVEVTLRPDDAAPLERATRRAATQTDPQNRIALVLATDLVVAPTVMTALTDGRLQISGGFSQQEALDLQVRLGG